MSTLYTARTGSGIVTITEHNVILDKPGGMASETIARASITGVSRKTTFVKLFGLGGAQELIITTQSGRGLTLKLVKPADAEQLLAILR